MRYTSTKLNGVWIIDLERFEDERGFFARTYCEDEFAEHGLITSWPQCSLSHNKLSGTLRGMHYQAPPHEETKLVRCVRGAIFDVVLDIRPNSETFGQWIGVDLTAGNQRALYIPDGFAHGFQTLEDESDVYYQISARYVPQAARGIRWNDPQLGIAWPKQNPIVSARDCEYPLFSALKTQN